MIKCQICQGDIRITKTINGQYAASCGSIQCQNATIFNTLLDASKYAETIYGKPFTELTWEGKKIKSEGKWLI